MDFVVLRGKVADSVSSRPILPIFNIVHGTVFANILRHGQQF